MDSDYTAFVHLVGPHNPASAGPLWAQDDSEPCRRSYSTSAWEMDEIVVDRFSLPIPPEALPGEYQLVMGFYDWPTLDRLSTVDAAGQVAGDHIVLAQLQIGEHD